MPVLVLSGIRSGKYKRIKQENTGREGENRPEYGEGEVMAGESKWDLIGEITQELRTWYTETQPAFSDL